MLDKLAGATSDVVDQDAWETTNLLTVSAALAAAAALREETRGSHWREDFPDAGRRPLGRPLRRRHVRRRDHACRSLAAPRRRMGRRGDRPDAVRPAADAAPARARRRRPRTRPRCTPPWSRRSRRTCPDGGDDVTSAATISPDAHGKADFGAREAGTVAGLGVAALVFHYVMGDDVEITDRMPDGTRVTARRRGDAGRRPDPRAAHRRADRAQLRQPPVRGRDRDRGLGRRPRGHPGPGPRHPQDAAGLPRPPEVRRAVRRRGQPPVQPLRHGDGQGQPRAGGRGSRARPTTRCARRYPGLRVEVEVTDLDQLRELLDAGCREILLDNMSTETMAEAVAARRTAGPRSRRPAGSPSSGPARSRRRGWTSSPSAR